MQPAVNQTNLPVDLMIWVLQEGVIKPSVLKTFLFLKLTYPDRLVQSESLYEDIAAALNVNIKTIKSHIKQLLKVRFLSADKRTNIIFVRSKYKLVPKSKRISKYSLKINITELKHFTEYLIAATVAYMVRKRMAMHKKASINDGAQQRLCILNLRYRIGLPISLSYIAKFLGKSISWVNKYKQKAKALGWLKVRRNWSQTDIAWQSRYRYLSVREISAGRIKKYRGKLCIVDSDLLSSSVIIVKRKKV